jgi:hypothetical protein
MGTARALSFRFTLVMALGGVGTALVLALLWYRPRRSQRVIGALAPPAILERLRALPIYYWFYRDRLDVRHIGPLAQDFNRRFRVGDSDKAIYTVDALGVNFAAIQALAARLDALEARLDSGVPAARPPEL